MHSSSLLLFLLLSILGSHLSISLSPAPHLTFPLPLPVHSRMPSSAASPSTGRDIMFGTRLPPTFPLLFLNAGQQEHNQKRIPPDSRGNIQGDSREVGRKIQSRNQGNLGKPSGRRLIVGKKVNFMSQPPHDAFWLGSCN
ncbi:hypothetical protein BDP55DRAFT_292793 [Colletotrichum godetiae]|uniref:Uncharacterized protein n=1 Tax=Colletotrichum godetiae TaxID=1209918 RepID=A0AAJ0ERP1_9PEZI|nr:uncharacterized protein BDP55DRAFT_292793 [Colletotrichum godetiae]KAK1671543.1 hypothetical protein BDP55DRAFT_292793 [Colletotrichum godetiae]